MLRTSGGEFCGRYASVTLFSIGVAPAVPVISAFHSIYRAFGLVIGEPADAVSGADHSLHVRSAFAEFPERARNASDVPAGTSARHRKLPHRDAVPVSCGGASYDPAAPG